MVIKRGNPLLKGCTKTGDGYNFTFESEKKDVRLCIYDKTGRVCLKKIAFEESDKIGDCYAVCIRDKKLGECLYGYEVDGVPVIDPYAKTITNCAQFGQEQEQDIHISRVALSVYHWGEDHFPHIPYDEAVFYKCSVRGMTMSKTSKVRHKGTFQGLSESVSYLKELGITSLLLMPAYEFDECIRFPQFYDNSYGKYAALPMKGRINYWGYTKAFYFAPKASFTALAEKKTDYTTEFKDMVKKMHRNGLEVLMEMHFTDESVDFVLHCLHYWVMEYHVDGFQVYAPEAVLSAVAQDPLLSRTKIITEYYRDRKKTIKNMANYQTGFLNVARKFLKGDENQLRDFVGVSRSNPIQSANINYIAGHDGFTLFDLVSYDRKHNEANGENNTDGENFNNSWNCGVEGETRKRKVLQLRKRQIKNALMLVFLSQGTPLLMAGDENLNSQQGNNNPYCLDNEISWVTWKKRGMAAEITHFVRELIAFRKEHKILHMEHELLSYDSLSCGYPDVSLHGSSAWYDTMESYNRHIGVMYCSRYAQPNDTDTKELIYIAYNMHWEAHELALPNVQDGTWKVVLSSGESHCAKVADDGKSVWVEPRCIAVLIGAGL